MKEGWRLMKLEECAEIKMGQSPEGKYYNSDGIGTPLINGPADYGNKNPLPKQWTTHVTKICQPGDIIFCVRATVGKMNVANHVCCIGRGVAAIHGKENVALTEYLMEAIAYQVPDIAKIAKSAGTTFPNITSKDLARRIIPIPPIPEQKRIAEILTAADSAIEEADRAVKESERAKQGVMQKLIPDGKDGAKEGWNIVRLGDVVDINPETRTPTVDNWNDIISYIDIDAVENCSGKITTPKRILFRDSPSRARRVIRKEDVIISMVRPELKAFAYVPNILDNQICSTGFAVLRGKGNTDPHYLLNIMFTERVINQFRKMTVGGQYPSLTQKTISQTEILLPTLTEQKRIAEILSVADEKIELCKQRKALLEKTKQGLMQKLLGGIDV